MEAPRCPYCGEKMKSNCARTIFWYFCPSCMSCSPDAVGKEAAYAVAMKRDNKYREQVEFDVKAALNALNRISNEMPYHIYSMLFDQISAIGHAPNCPTCSFNPNRKEKDNEYGA